MNIKKDKTTFPTIHRRIILVFILSAVFAIYWLGVPRTMPSIK